MAANKYSLYGRAFQIRNLLRGGGPSVDDDRYSLRLIGEEILTQGAVVRQAELFDLDNRGYTPDPSQMVTALLSLKDYSGIPITGKPVVIREADLPSALQWRGNPAIFGLTTRPDEPGWAVKNSAWDAVASAIKKPYIPARPAGWLESGKLAVALPLDWSMVQELYVRFIPAAININALGQVMNPETETLTITELQWGKIEPLVLQALNPMLQTMANRDTRNNGKDDSAK